ncbi:hypothetical protein [Spirosoma sp.]|uniref:hypothetical protein n=1 Tax=Spirosoma sp. TaxID=1899569 RepID=UPI003B39FA6B
MLSTDGGQSFTTVLASNTPNDGSQVITLPNVVTTQARIKVASSNNIFFDISNADFTITDALPDLTPVLYTSPSTHYGNTNFTVVVDVFEINSVSTSGLVTARISKDSKFNLTMPPTATSIGSRSVQNSAWSFSALDPDYYVLTTEQVIDNGTMLSFGLTGLLSPGATSGILSISSMLVGGSGGESMSTIANNVDADKIDYFQQ